VEMMSAIGTHDRILVALAILCVIGTVVVEGILPRMPRTFKEDRFWASALYFGICAGAGSAFFGKGGAVLGVVIALAIDRMDKILAAVAEANERLRRLEERSGG
jgi:uncharacterized membrane protein YfcA